MVVRWQLAIDTSGPTSFLALSPEAGAEVISWSGCAHGAHDEELAHAVNGLMSRAGVNATMLSAISVGLGPGSFTGLRISLSFAKGMALALRIPLIGISSFEAMAWEFRKEQREIVVVADARRHELFFSRYRPTADGITICAEGAGQSPVTIVAEARLQELALDTLVVSQDEFANLGRPVRQPMRVAESLLELARRNEPRASYSVEDLIALSPSYVRAVSAQTIAERQARAGTSR